jgi:hypothetical protein
VKEKKKSKNLHNQNRIPKHPLIGQVVIRKAFDWEDELERYRKLSVGNSRKGSLEKNFG